MLRGKLTVSEHGLEIGRVRVLEEIACAEDLYQYDNQGASNDVKVVSLQKVLSSMHGSALVDVTEGRVLLRATQDLDY